MRILVTNDDGIHSDGLTALEEIARALSSDVWVVAPENDNSGVSHSLSLTRPLRMRRIDERRHAVDGTPTDCVIMATRQLLQDHRPDLILSGINRGFNVADDVTYSGTVAGAIEGTLLGIRSIALSQGYPPGDRNAIRYDDAVRMGPGIVRSILDANLPRGTLANVNFPSPAAGPVKGVRVVRQGARDQEFLGVEQRMDARGGAYYWLAYRPAAFTAVAGTDLEAVREGYVAVTPLQLDLTDGPAMDGLAAALGAAT
jgi:5'-nucleotidase